jgi:hypothetical protein
MASSGLQKNKPDKSDCLNQIKKCYQFVTGGGGHGPHPELSNGRTRVAGGKEFPWCA